MNTKKANQSVLGKTVKKTSPPPFERVAAADGKFLWRLTPRLELIQSDLKAKKERFEDIKNKELQGSFIAVEMMQRRVMAVERGGEDLQALADDEALADYFSDIPLDPEEAKLCALFVMAFARRLTPAMPAHSNPDPDAVSWAWLPQTKSEALSLKKSAIKWVSNVIDTRFSNLLMKPEKLVERALELIPVALAMCNKNNKMPTKCELAAEAGKVYGARWNTDDETHRHARNAAGLEGLPDKTRGPDRPSAPRKQRNKGD